MTDKTEVLRALIEAVEAGEVRPYVIEEMAAPQFHHSQWPLVAKAYHGSLDAAKALHDALLPGWDYIIGHTNGGLTIHVKFEGQDVAFSDTPARAWLLAILRAYLYEQESK